MTEKPCGYCDGGGRLKKRNGAVVICTVCMGHGSIEPLPSDAWGSKEISIWASRAGELRAGELGTILDYAMEYARVTILIDGTQYKVKAARCFDGTESGGGMQVELLAAHAEIAGAGR